MKLAMEDNKMLNEEELNAVVGGLAKGVCAKDSSNKAATRSFCGDCGRIRRISAPLNRVECICSNGVPGSWNE